MSGAWSKDVKGTWASLVPAGTAPSLVGAWYALMAPKVMQYITQGWPVDTARSLAGWYTKDSLVKNDVEYTSFVHDGLADRLWAEALQFLTSDAQKTLNDILARSATTPGLVTPQVEAIQAILAPEAAPFGGFASTPTPGLSAAQLARTPMALFQRRTLVGLRAAERVAHDLWKAGRIPKRAVTLVRERRLTDAVALLNSRGLYQEARTIQAAVQRAQQRITR